MFIVDLELSIKSVDILQKIDVWLLSDVIDMMRNDPATITLALAKIKYDDFVVITEEIKKRTKNVLDETDKTQ